MTYKAYEVTKREGEKALASIVERSTDDLPPGEVTIDVKYSSLNYKDALSATGSPGVTKNYPHVPGIDAAGAVRESSVDTFKPGDEVLVTGYDLGVNTSGGYGCCIRVPSEWVVPLPDGLTLRESMILGTAGFTAALGVHLLLLNGMTKDGGEVVVTGASGGVGSLAVMILSKLGYHVTAATGKKEAHIYLRDLGARDVINRGELDDVSGRPLLRGRWGAGFDAVGGNTLATVLKSTHQGAPVAACGVVGGPDLATTVFPFILRGVKLLGIDSALCKRPLRLELWERLAGAWKPDSLDAVCTEIGLEQLTEYVGKILKGQIRGRTLVSLEI
ncbi:MAG: YhdH/YhfP family quinone oxidoreductase [candidate division KSB1 bacterium]|jgi:putative YhdH/YhfP family quinone oxidoreductase|nr:YhdH/YhfP family quinone oxidoreductase [candidate division KSB1 bacterium]